MPWRISRGSQAPRSADELRLLCLSFNLVLDLRTQAISTDAGLGLPDPMVTTVHTERGRSEGSVKAQLSWKFEEI